MVFAVDFDGTLCQNAFPEIGKPKWIVIEMCKTLKDKGHKLILWTCREGENLEKAVEWCETYGLSFDAVNDALPEQKQMWKNETRKIWADCYIDDKAVHPDTVAAIYTGAEKEGW